MTYLVKKKVSQLVKLTMESYGWKPTWRKVEKDTRWSRVPVSQMRTHPGTRV